VQGKSSQLLPGEIDAVSPTIGDIHKVRNAFDDQISISIHVYGANIGAVKRHVYAPLTGERKEFISGFSADTLPNIWM
jgi:predicted metal-dependent enzyme (double-stranded beta helix superfamily)